MTFEIYQFFDIEDVNVNLKYNIIYIINNVLLNKNQIIH